MDSRLTLVECIWVCGWHHPHWIEFLVGISLSASGRLTVWLPVAARITWSRQSKDCGDCGRQDKSQNSSSAPSTLCDSLDDIVESFHILGTIIKWELHISCITKKSSANVLLPAAAWEIQPAKNDRGDEALHCHHWANPHLLYNHL